MATKIDITKPVRTRDGRPVTLLTDKGRNGRTLLGYVDDEIILYSWTDDGVFRQGMVSTVDLAQDNEVWVNIYSTEFMGVFPTKEDALRSVKEPIARVRVPYTPGQFD